MKTTRFLSLLCVSLAMFALPAAAQTTPANAGICDPLADATPGLQGLCVAMCEAQACEAEFDTNTGEVVFNPSCSPASDELLANYNRLADFEKKDPDPSMPCVKVACPCWTQAELEDIGGVGTDSCIGGENWTYLQSGTVDKGVWEYAIASGNACASSEAGFSGSRSVSGLSADKYGTCLKTITDACTARGLK